MFRKARCTGLALLCWLVHLLWFCRLGSVARIPLHLVLCHKWLRLALSAHCVLFRGRIGDGPVGALGAEAFSGCAAV